MTKEEKINEIKTLSKDLSETPNFYLADIAGLDSKSTLDLRRACFKSNIRISVVKNTLLKKAMEDSGKEFGDLKTTLKGNTSVMFSEKGNIPAKLIKDFRKKFDKPVLKGAFVEESIYIGDDKINVLADLKSKDEIIGEIITLLMSPINNVLLSLKSGSNKISGIIKKLSEKQ
tara:strand:- start:1247 stop:1765 length:519 start_codon:yes stop_codon:yes gene_type:complete